MEMTNVVSGDRFFCEQIKEDSEESNYWETGKAIVPRKDEEHPTNAQQEEDDDETNAWEQGKRGRNA